MVAMYRRRLLARRHFVLDEGADGVHCFQHPDITGASTLLRITY
jgi:hypothetical protein